MAITRLAGLAVLLVLVCAWPARAQDTVTITDPLSGVAIAVPVGPPSPDVPGAHDQAMHVALAALMGAHAADLSTTMYLIGKCGGPAGCDTRDGGHVRAEESNPRLAPFQYNPMRFAAVKYGMALASITTVYKLHAKHPTLARTLAYIQTAVITTAALNNQRLLDTTK